MSRIEPVRQTDIMGTATQKPATTTAEPTPDNKAVAAEYVRAMIDKLGFLALVIDAVTDPTAAVVSCIANELFVRSSDLDATMARTMSQFPHDSAWKAISPPPRSNPSADAEACDAAAGSLYDAVKQLGCQGIPLSKLDAAGVSVAVAAARVLVAHAERVVEDLLSREVVAKLAKIQ